MYFDLSPRSRVRHPRRQSPPRRSASPPTTTTTLLPFRRSGQPIDVAAALSPVQEYAQPQWSVRPHTEPLFAPPSNAAATSHLLSPPPMREPFREPITQQQQQQQQQQHQQEQQRQPHSGNQWQSAAAPHAYYVGDNADTHGGPRTFSSKSAGLGGNSVPSPLSSAAPLPRQPFASTPAGTPVRRDSMLRSCSQQDRCVDRPAGPAVTRAVGLSSHASASRPRGRGITEVRPGCTTSTERVRYRNNVTKKLIDLYDEVAELYECRENMNFQVSQAMRSDPRFTKERHGEVRLAYKPTPSQQAAMAAVDTALEVLHDACHELVASYLTPEEKRYLGIDTHLFQTRAEKKSTYQYAPATTKAKSKTSPHQQQQQRQPSGTAEAASVPSSRASSPSTAQRHHHRDANNNNDNTNDDEDASRLRTPPHDVKFASQATSLPSAPTPLPPPTQHTFDTSLSPSPIQEERTASASGTLASPPSRGAMHHSAMHTASVDEAPYQFVMEQSSPLAAAAPPSPTPVPPSPHGVALPKTAAAPSGTYAHAEPEDTVAEGSTGSPERMYAPAASTSSLGGGGWPSDTASATVRAPSVFVPQPSTMVKTAPLGGSVTMRGPQGQVLVKVPVQAPVAMRASPTSKWPPGIPPGAKLVKMPMGVAPPSQLAAAAAAPAPAAAAAPPSSSHPPSRPPSRTNSVTNRTTAAAPKAPPTRAEFKKFLIDSDSDSTMA